MRPRSAAIVGNAVARIVWSSTAGSIAKTIAPKGMASDDRDGWESAVGRSFIAVRLPGYTQYKHISSIESSMTHPQGLRERKKQQTRDLIAETARSLFTERGFDAITVDEVAREADVSRKTVFNYFPTKEDLVYWRLETFESELLTAI